MQELEKRGGIIEYKAATPADLEKYAAQSDLVIVAAGKGDIARMFERDAQKSQYDAPQRALALTYVKGLTPRPHHSGVNFNIAPGVGEYFVFPSLTTTGPCEIMVFEGIPGGPMDCWGDVRSPDQHLAKSKWILDTFLPWEAERAKNVELTDTERHSCRTSRRRPSASRSRICRPARQYWAWPTLSCSTIRSPDKDLTMPRSARRSISTRSLRRATSRSTRPGCRRPLIASGITCST